MARPRAYIEDQVRENVMMTFYKYGYAATSLTHLESATGLNRRQLYNACGDKRGLFLRALDDFGATAGAEFLSELEQPDAGVDAIAATFHKLLAAVGSPRGRLGCLVCNTAREPVADDAEVAKRIQGFFGRIRRAYRRALRNAGEDDADKLANHLFGVHVAGCVLARAGERKAVIADLFDAALATLR